MDVRARERAMSETQQTFLTLGHAEDLALALACPECQAPAEGLCVDLRSRKRVIRTLHRLRLAQAVTFDRTALMYVPRAQPVVIPDEEARARWAQVQEEAVWQWQQDLNPPEDEDARLDLPEEFTVPTFVVIPAKPRLVRRWLTRLRGRA